MLATYIHGGNTNKFRIRQQRYFDKVHVGSHDVVFMHITCIAYQLQHQFSILGVNVFGLWKHNF